VTVENKRVEDESRKFDFIINRGLTDFSTFHNLTHKLIRDDIVNDFPNGLISLKGGNLDFELQPFKQSIYQFPLSDYFSESFFHQKSLVYLPVG
jgi:16S rRNA (guanine527-N7)-methyltransferase